MVGVYLTFQEIIKLLFKAMVLLYIPPAVCEDSNCSTSSPAPDMVILFNFGHSNGCIKLHCSLNFCLSWWKTMLNMFLCAYWSLVYHVLWSVCSNLLLIFKSRLVVWLLNYKNSLYILNTRLLYRLWIFFVFAYFNCSFWRPKLVILGKFHLSISSFAVYAFES